MFSILKGFAVGNPWVTVLLLAALIGLGFSGGVYLERLLKNAEISRLELAASRLQTTLSNNLVEAQGQAAKSEHEENTSTT